jgi:hypothetical protein
MFNYFVNTREKASPAETGEKAVSYRVGDKIQRSNRRVARRNDHPLDAQEKKKRPEQVHELRRHHQGSQGGAGCNLFRREGDSEVPNKHKNSRLQ